MRIRLLTALASPEESWAAGDLYECDDSTAQRMFAAGYAVPVSAGPAPIIVEDAMADGGRESAVVKTSRQKRKA